MSLFRRKCKPSEPVTSGDLLDNINELKNTIANLAENALIWAQEEIDEAEVDIKNLFDAIRERAEEKTKAAGRAKTAMSELHAVRGAPPSHSFSEPMTYSEQIPFPDLDGEHIVPPASETVETVPEER